MLCFHHQFYIFHCYLLVFIKEVAILDSFLNPNLNEKLCEISAQGLAYVGDAVFELMVRTYLVSGGTWSSGKLHEKAVSYVSAGAQAAASEVILPLLSEEELEVFRRGRNAHAGAVPKNATGEQYHAATGIEALFGYLYLLGRMERIDELFDIIVRN